MAGKVQSVTLSEFMENLRNKEWLIPEFQRDFVWNINQITALCESLLASKPVGLITLWEQPETDMVPLEPIKIEDSIGNTKIFQEFKSDSPIPKKHYAIIDGKQRATALAMAFGGLKANHSSYRYSGAYYLDITSNDIDASVKFIKNKDIQDNQYDHIKNCLSKGIIPLSNTTIIDLNKEYDIQHYWLHLPYLIGDKEKYIEDCLPTKEEIERRVDFINRCQPGVVQSKVAIYEIPSSYDLGAVCEIFEVLNTAGTKVSTVDIIHAVLYKETSGEEFSEEIFPFKLREWISNISEYDGCAGWATNKRPELLTQIVTAIYLGLDQKDEPRRISGQIGAPITSVKSSDLLVTPLSHWLRIIKHERRLAEYLSDFQQCVAGGPFSYLACPYPLTAAIYVALRWKQEEEKMDCSKSDIDVVFRAFFWRNALLERYDQGFLSQMPTDLKKIIELLRNKKQYKSTSEWLQKYCQVQFDILFKNDIVSTKNIKKYISQKLQNGALYKALCLHFVAKPGIDIISNNDLSINPEAEHDMHHIFPRAWCEKNGYKEKNETKEFIESLANLMPLSKKTNTEWKDYNPSHFINIKKIDFDTLKSQLKNYFIDKCCYDYLDSSKPEEFWKHRAELMADDIYKRQLLEI